MLTNRIIIIASLIYVLPIVFYGLMFGPSLSDSHMRWAEFGSAISGIYAPIVAFTTLAVLIRQTKLQSEMHNHQYVQAYTGQSRADIDFYAVQLAASLKDSALLGVTIRDYLHSHFQEPNLKSHDDAKALELAVNLDRMVPQVMGMWAAIYPIIGGLESQKNPLFKMTLHSSMQRLIALLSFETCACLDNFYRVRCEGRLVVPYKFSPTLTDKDSI